MYKNFLNQGDCKITLITRRKYPQPGTTSKKVSLVFDYSTP